jgi:hypothetical protein
MRRPRFNPKAVHVGFVADKVVLRERFYRSNSAFSPVLFHRMLNFLSNLLPGASRRYGPATGCRFISYRLIETVSSATKLIQRFIFNVWELQFHQLSCSPEIVVLPRSSRVNLPREPSSDVGNFSKTCTLNQGKVKKTQFLQETYVLNRKISHKKYDHNLKRKVQMNKSIPIIEGHIVASLGRVLGYSLERADPFVCF